MLNQVFSPVHRSMPSDILNTLVRGVHRFLYRLWELRSFNVYVPENLSPLSEKIYQI